MDKGAGAAIALIATLAGCGSARTPKTDMLNDFHCGVAFAVARGIASTSADQDAAKVEQYFSVWADYAAKKSAKLPEQDRTRSQGEELRRMFVADAEGHREVTLGCVDRMGREPEFATYYGNLSYNVRRSLR